MYHTHTHYCPCKAVKKLDIGTQVHVKLEMWGKAPDTIFMYLSENTSSTEPLAPTFRST